MAANVRRVPNIATATIRRIPDAASACRRTPSP